MKTHTALTWVCGAAAVILAGSVLLSIISQDKSMEICIGTYGDNLYIYEFDTDDLEFRQKGHYEADNPSYALYKDGHIYAVSETGAESGLYSFDKNGEKTAGLRQTGADPCFIMTYGSYVMTADYSGGSVSVFPTENGVLKDCCQTLRFEGSGPVTERQEKSHIHQLRTMPESTEWILASDLGSDCIRILKASPDNENLLSHEGDIPCPAGSGPRHMEFSKDGRTLYCIAELSGNVLVYAIEYTYGKPEFRLIQEVLADEVNAGGSADIHLHPSGDYLYTSHRLDNDGIAIFKTRPDGTIEKIGYIRTARHPRNFMISEDGKLLLAACRDDRVIQVFRITEDGLLTLTPSVLRFESDKPSSVLMSLRSESDSASESAASSKDRSKGSAFVLGPNPVITNIYTADPSARVFGDTLYVYPSHDRDDAKGFDMIDYHVFSTVDMVEFTDHGVAFNPIEQTTWAHEAAWAPDCIERGGKYYLYYPTDRKHIGVAVSDSPTGPFEDPLGHPLISIDSPGVICDRDFIDPCVFIDDDGQAYLFMGQNTVCAIKLNEDMTSYDGEVHIIEGLKEFFEAVWVHKKDGKYYMSYSNSPFTGHQPQIAYAVSDSPLGPYEYKGVILGPVNSGTNHHSIVEYRGEWFIFYHTADLSRRNLDIENNPQLAGACSIRRSVCVDRLYYDEDGNILFCGDEDYSTRTSAAID